MQNARRLLLRAVGQRVNTAQPPGCALAAPGCLSSTPTSPAPTSRAYSIFSPASVSTSQPAVGAAGGASSSGVGSGGSSSSSGRNPVVIPPCNPVLQRYSELLEAGSLQQDEQQLVLVQELARLYDEICSYKSRMDEYHRATAEHQAQRLKRLQELLAEDAAAEEAEEQRRRQRQQQGGVLGSGAGAAEEPAATSIFSGLGSWLKSALGPLSGVGAAGSAAAAADSPLARARAVAARREEVLRREIGPPPEAPEPPRGIYVWGSVGSGKSMLVSLFYQALMETAQLPASRWMHFNAAMLEVHSRLHHLDTERWRQRDERERAHSHHRHQQQQQQQAVQQQPDGEAQLARSGDIDEYDEEEEEEAEAGLSPATSCRGAHALGSGAGSGRGRGEGGGGTASKTAGEGEGEGDELLPVPEHLQGVFRHWDPKRDPEVLRQREAKAAMLAVRRHMRLARLGRHDPRTLAAANAQGLVRMAASFIRGRAGDPRSGWGAAGGSGPIASVLYFDEVQVTDVFSAVALKGLVEALTSAGCVLVCTSNRSPLELPRHGLHEDMWGHFVDTLLQRCAVHELSSPADYRRVLLEQGRASIAAAAAAAAAAGSSGSSSSGSVSGAATAAPQLWPPLARSYILAAGPDGTAELEQLWRARAMAEGGSAAAAAAGLVAAAAAAADGERALTVPVLFGRSLEVRRASACGGAAWFSFGELCGRPLGPADYVALSQRFHTVFLEGVPAMSMQVRDQARRFITLLDELYNARCVLVASAEVPPEELFASGGAEGWEAILDIEGLQFETAVEGARLRRDVTAGGGVAPVASSPTALAAAMGALGGAEERFAFRRAVSRLLEMQSPQYINAALRLRQQQQRHQQQQQQHAPQQQ